MSRLRVPRPPASPFDTGPFPLSHGRGMPLQATRAHLAADADALHVRFVCDDREPWGTLRERDAPLYQEEVVEVFLAPGEDDPRVYFEYEVSPLGVLFDARIENRDARRATMKADVAWDCAGIRWEVGLVPGGWWAALAIPWAPMLEGASMPSVWRANFFRIDRPRGASPEFSAWSPTLADPADFHVPARFGTLEL